MLRITPVCATLAFALAACVAPPPLAPGVVVPNANLKVEGIPPIPAALANEVALYTEFRPRSLASWHPVRRELVVATRATNTAQLFDVEAPLGGARADHRLCRAGALRRVVAGAAGRRWSSRATRRQRAGAGLPARSGREGAGAAHRSDAPAIGRLRSTARATGCSSRRTDVDRTAARARTRRSTSLLLDPLDPGKARTIATLPGTGWGDFSFSFDDRRLAMIEYKSVTESLRVGDGRRDRRAAPRAAGAGRRRRHDDRVVRAQLRARRQGPVRRRPIATASSSAPRTSTSSPAGSSTSGRRTGTSSSSRSSPDGRTIALVTNEAGVGVLRLYDADTRRELPRPAVPIGTVSERAVAPRFRRARVRPRLRAKPRRRVRARSRRQHRARAGPNPGSRASTPARSAAQQPIRWTSFDGREITGFITRPPASSPAAAR